MSKSTSNFRRNALIALGVLGAVVTTTTSARAASKQGAGPHADQLLGEALERYADEPATLAPARSLALPITDLAGERSHFAAHARRLVKDLTATGAYTADELVAMKLMLLAAEHDAATADEAELPGLFANLVADLLTLPRVELARTDEHDPG